MDKIGPKEAADTIRADYQREHVDPHFQHQVRFAGDVLAELGEEKSPENIAKAMRLLDKAGIEGHAYNDYPKWVQNERGERAVVNDEEHEEAFMARPAPADDAGVPNPEHGHVDPQSGEFTAGVAPTTYDIRHDGPAPYEPGAKVFEPGGQHGPEALPVSDANPGAKPVAPPKPADQAEWRTPEQIAAGLPKERPPYGKSPENVAPPPESVG